MFPGVAVLGNALLKEGERLVGKRLLRDGTFPERCGSADGNEFPNYAY